PLTILPRSPTDVQDLYQTDQDGDSPINYKMKAVFSDSQYNRITASMATNTSTELTLDKEESYEYFILFYSNFTAPSLISIVQSKVNVAPIFAILKTSYTETHSLYANSLDAHYHCTLRSTERDDFCTGHIMESGELVPV
ncbi:hypothetical protein ABVT39_017413, partial [Epinephelus coioides]